MKKTIFLSIILLTGVFLLSQYFFQEARKDDSAVQKIVSEPQNFMPKLNKNYLWGGIAKEMFPDITSPTYIEPSEAQFLKDSDEVFVVQTTSALYVYPVSIMSFHHIVNDVIDGEPVAITYCLLADTAVTFQRNLNNQTTEFGVLGPLYMGDLVMYDKKTDKSFLQLTGQEFTKTKTQQVLQPYKPITRELWSQVKNMHNVRVLVPVENIEFYTKFYSERKNASVGINSLTTKGLKVDLRLPELTKGVGLITERGPLFLELGEGNLNEQTLAQLPEHSYAVQVYWYVWSGLFPETSTDSISQ